MTVTALAKMKVGIIEADVQNMRLTAGPVFVQDSNGDVDLAVMLVQVLS